MPDMPRCYGGGARYGDPLKGPNPVGPPDLPTCPLFLSRTVNLGSPPALEAGGGGGIQ